MSNALIDRLHLLTLPDEIQFQIYEYVVPPWSLAFCDSLKYCNVDSTVIFEQTKPTGISTPPGHELRLTCREFFSIVGNLQKRQFTGDMYLSEFINDKLGQYQYHPWIPRVRRLHLTDPSFQVTAVLPFRKLDFLRVTYHRYHGSEAPRILLGPDGFDAYTIDRLLPEDPDEFLDETINRCDSILEYEGRSGYLVLKTVVEMRYRFEVRGKSSNLILGMHIKCDEDTTEVVSQSIWHSDEDSTTLTYWQAGMDEDDFEIVNLDENKAADKSDVVGRVPEQLEWAVSLES